MKLYSYWRSLATFRVRIALNLKGLDYEPINVDLDAGQQRAAEFKAVNPQMVIPALVEDDGNVLFQSMAIMEYLNEVYPEPPLLPADPRGRARVRALSLITVADFASADRAARAQSSGRHVQPGRCGQDRLGAPLVRGGLDAYELHLSRDQATGAYCHGDRVTMADLCLVSHAIGHRVFKGEFDQHPTVKRIVERCMADDRFARAQPLRQPGAPASH